MEKYLRIGQVAAAVGINPKTIRYYEEIGLIRSPMRKQGGWASAGHRLFSEEDVKWLKLIKKAKLLDLSLAQIAELLQCIEDGQAASKRSQLHSLINEKLQEIDQKMEDLKVLRDKLKQLSKTFSGKRQVSPGTSTKQDSSVGCCEPLCAPNTCETVLVEIEEPRQKKRVRLGEAPHQP